MRSFRNSTYTLEELENALQAVLTGQLNVKQASKHFRIPYETLRRKSKIMAKNSLLKLMPLKLP